MSSEHRPSCPTHQQACDDVPRAWGPSQPWSSTTWVKKSEGGLVSPGYPTPCCPSEHSPEPRG